MAAKQQTRSARARRFLNFFLESRVSSILLSKLAGTNNFRVRKYRLRDFARSILCILESYIKLYRYYISKSYKITSYRIVWYHWVLDTRFVSVRECKTLFSENEAKQGRRNYSALASLKIKKKKKASYSTHCRSGFRRDGLFRNLTFYLFPTKSHRDENAVKAWFLADA